jgi:hypothetical protein
MEGSKAPRGAVAVYSVPGRGFAHSHEQSTRDGIARQLAALKGFDFVGEYNPERRFPGPIYLVPSDTLIGIEAAHALGARNEDDLFGGVVPHAFIATKSITHPLESPDATAPPGWSSEFGRRISRAVLSGFSAFTPKDALSAGSRLLARSPVRLKPVRATGGRGQIVVTDVAALKAALDAMDVMELASHGLVLEENLTEVTTYSVGQVRVAGLVVTYWGTQRLTPDNAGASVYGGSDLYVARGGFDQLLGLGASKEARLAVAQARAYDAAALACFPGMFASRRNYDVAQGLGADGRRRSGVLEQSWRIGGASGAELAALEAFHAASALRAVRASTFEVYGSDSTPPPPGAMLYFHGVDEQIGPLTKYATVEPQDADP